MEYSGSSQVYAATHWTSQEEKDDFLIDLQSVINGFADEEDVLHDDHVRL